MQQLTNPISEKIFKKTLSRSGKTVFNKKLVGHLIAGVIDNRVVIGYSLLHRKDVYDVVKGKRRPGHGKNIAKIRALKWKGKAIIEVPPSIAKQAQKFRDRCKRYYKNAVIPDISEQKVLYHDTRRLTGFSDEQLEWLRRS